MLGVYSSNHLVLSKVLLFVKLSLTLYIYLISFVSSGSGRLLFAKGIDAMHYKKNSIYDVYCIIRYLFTATRTIFYVFVVIASW